MTEPSRERVVDFSEIFRRIARRYRVVAVVAAVAIAVGITGGLLTPKEYTATATLTVSPISLDPLAAASASQQININTEREVLRSSEVARIAADSLGDDVDASLLNANSSVAAPSNSQVLQVSVAAPQPRLAADWANAMAAAYLDFRGQGAAQLAKGRIAELDERIADAQGAGDTATIADLRSERLALTQVSENPGRIIGVAEAPDSPSSLGLPVFAAGGLAVGVLLGAVLALIREATDTRVRAPQRLAAQAGGEPLIIRGRSDQEGYRWVLRAIRAPFAGVRRTRPLVVAVFGVAPADIASVVDGLRELEAETGAGVAVIGEARLPESKLDRPWKYQVPKGGGISLVLVDASHVRSGARRATLADAADVAIVATAPTSRNSELDSLLDSISRSGLAATIPVFTVGRSERDTQEAAAPSAEPTTRKVTTPVIEREAAPAFTVVGER